MTQTALIIPLPQAEALVEDIRNDYDPAAMFGVPAHISILYPFMAPDKMDFEVHRKLKAVFSRYTPFEFRLGEVRRFPNTLYLSVDPEEVFLSMTQDLTTMFPDFPPYSGEFGNIAPHLTLAFRHRLKWRSITKKVTQRLQSMGGVTGYCDSIQIIDNSTGRWIDMETIPLSDKG